MLEAIMFDKFADTFDVAGFEDEETKEVKLMFMTKDGKSFLDIERDSLSFFYLKKLVYRV